MKKLLVFLLLSSSLYAASFESNLLAQRLNPIEQLSNRGYELSVMEAKEVLYKDGVVIQEKTITPSSIEVKRGGKTETTRYEDGVVVSLLVEEKEKREETFYEYEDKTLFRKRVVVNGELERIITYYNDGATLVGYQIVELDKTSSVFFSSNTVSYTLQDKNEGEGIAMYPNGLLVRNEFSASTFSSSEVTVEDNKLVLTDKKSDESIKVSTYDEKGLLTNRQVTKAEEVLEATDFNYTDQGVITREESVLGNVKTVKLYEEGKLISQTTTIDGIIDKIRYYEEDGEFEIKYKNGKPFAKLIYDEDGKSLLDLEMQ